MKIPKIGLVICNSGSSNSGFITGLAATRAVAEFGEDVGICSLPAIANRIPRQVAVVKRMPHIIVIDGCHNKCASKILSSLDIKYDEYINLEDLVIKKLGPFTGLQYKEDDVEKVFHELASKIGNLLSKTGEEPRL